MLHDRGRIEREHNVLVAKCLNTQWATHRNTKQHDALSSRTHSYSSFRVQKLEPMLLTISLKKSMVSWRQYLKTWWNVTHNCRSSGWPLRQITRLWSIMYISKQCVWHSVWGLPRFGHMTLIINTETVKLSVWWWNSNSSGEIPIWTGYLEAMFNFVSR